jgi:hypothetical protein
MNCPCAYGRPTRQELLEALTIARNALLDESDRYPNGQPHSKLAIAIMYATDALGIKKKGADASYASAPRRQGSPLGEQREADASQLTEGEILPEQSPDCRTCRHFGWSGCQSLLVCTAGDMHAPTQPVKLWEAAA